MQSNTNLVVIGSTSSPKSNAAPSESDITIPFNGDCSSIVPPLSLNRCATFLIKMDGDIPKLSTLGVKHS